MCTLKTLLLSLAVCVFAKLQTQAATEPAFNGRDFSGWKLPTENLWWTVENGILIGTQDVGLKGHVLETEKEFRDVVVELETRWSGDVDGGIFLRKGQKWQCQLGVSRSLKKDMTCSVYVAGKGYVVEAKHAGKFLNDGEWNTVKVEARADHYRIWLNGELVVDAELPGFNEAGPLGLQIHEGVKDMRMEFRNITVTPL